MLLYVIFGLLINVVFVMFIGHLMYGSRIEELENKVAQLMSSAVLTDNKTSQEEDVSVPKNNPPKEDKSGQTAAFAVVMVIIVIVLLIMDGSM